MFRLIKVTATFREPFLFLIHLFKPSVATAIVLLFVFAVFGIELWAEEASKPLEVINRQPQLSAVYPMATQPGTRVRLELRGEFLDRVSLVRFESEDVSGTVLSSSSTTAQVEIEVTPQASPGARFFRLISPRGASNLLLFRISQWPTPTETEPNDDLDSPMEVHPPVLISARLHSVEDIDLYRFHAKAGERIQFNLLGARNWSSADASLAILHLDGREILHDEGRFIWDPYMDHVFDAEGDYLAAVTATRMPAGGQPRTDLNYQLSIGQSPFLWWLFPFGAARGGSIELALRGDFVASTMPVVFYSKGINGRIEGECKNGLYKLSTTIDAQASLGVHELFLKESSGTLAPLKFIVGGLPEKMEVEPNEGREQSQTVSFPVTINGRIDRDGDEDWYRISVDAGQALAFIIDAEKYGSPLDSHLTLLDSTGKMLAVNDDAKWIGRPLNRDSRIEFTFKEKGDYFLKVSSLYRHGAEDYVYRLTVRPQQPHFMLALNNDRPTVHRGGKGKLDLTLLRQEGFKGELTIHVDGLPPGVRARPLTIAADKETEKLELEANAEADLSLSEIEVYGTATIDGEIVREKASLPGPRIVGSGPGFTDYKARKALLAVVEPARFSLESAANTIYLVRGGNVEFGVKVARRPEFAQPLEITLENLPAGVSVDKVEMIDEGRMARITLKASESAPRARVPDLVILGKATANSLQYSEAAPRITLQVD